MWNSAEQDWGEQRKRMVDKQLRRRGITDSRVLAAMGELPREEFVEGKSRDNCYNDEPVAIGFGQTMSQPYMTALMVQSLQLRGDEKVLEIGAGSGYHAAVLGRLARRVYAVEVVPDLAMGAEQHLRRSGCGENIEVICADGSLGWAQAAPYDAISVEAGAPGVPPALKEQLADGGRIVIPVGEFHDQCLEVIERRGDQFVTHLTTHCRFVPLVGEMGWDR